MFIKKKESHLKRYVAEVHTCKPMAIANSKDRNQKVILIMISNKRGRYSKKYQISRHDIHYCLPSLLLQNEEY